MAANIVSHQGGNPPSAQPSSFQVVQDAIFALSRRTERLSGMHYEAFQVKFEDIANLEQRILQVAASVHGQCGDTVVSVNYSDNRVERHSGVDRFSMHGTVRNCVVESIDVDFEIAVKTKDGAEPRLYSVSVGVRSFVGVSDRMNRKKTSEMEKRIFRDLDQATARYMIKYVDYMVARSIEVCIEDWFKSLRVATDIGFLTKIRNNSNYLVSVSSMMGFGVVAILIYLTFGDRVQTVKSFFPIALASAFSLFVSDRLTRSIAKRLVDWLKETSPSSFISISDADKEALQRQQSKGFFAAKLVVIWLASLPGVVLASWISDYFFPFSP